MTTTQIIEKARKIAESNNIKVYGIDFTHSVDNGETRFSLVIFYSDQSDNVTASTSSVYEQPSIEQLFLKFEYEINRLAVKHKTTEITVQSPPPTKKVVEPLKISKYPKYPK